MLMSDLKPGQFARITRCRDYETILGHHIGSVVLALHNGMYAVVIGGIVGDSFGHGGGRHYEVEPVTVDLKITP